MITREGVESLAITLALNLVLRCMELGVRVPPPDEAIASAVAFLSGEACPIDLAATPVLASMRAHHKLIDLKWTDAAAPTPADLINTAPYRITCE